MILPVVILGAGPAGMSCALWLQNMGLTPILVECAQRPGGLQNFQFLKNTSVLGQQNMTGPALARRFVGHLATLGVRIFTTSQVKRIQRATNGTLTVAILSPTGTTEFACSAVVLATGTRYRGGEVLADMPGFDSIPSDSLISGPHCFAQLDAVAGRHVFIVGAGDNAYENALMLLARGARVSLLARSSPSAQSGFTNAVATHPAFSLFAQTQIRRARVEPPLIHLILSTPAQEVSLVVERSHILAGYSPNTAEITDLLAAGLGHPPTLDERGYIIADASGRTGIAGIYVAGDVCTPEFPSVVNALSAGARVARTIELDQRRLGLLPT